MSQLSKVFTKLERTGKKAFVPYVMAGTEGLTKFKEQLLFLQETGATMIEVGIPFSDPTADGPTIQYAGTLALQQGITLEKVMLFLEEIKAEISIPIVIMTYVNPVIQYGIERFVAQMVKGGISGCIIPDLPLEEEELITPYLNEAKIDFIRLVTLTSSEERLKRMIANSSGFLYAVTVTGTTGSRTSFDTEFVAYLQHVKRLSPIPVLAGFGISTVAQIQEINAQCDGVIVGSKLIELFEKEDYASIQQLIEAAIC